ncbi:hypothetical protein K488DRAFT_39381, partial [Vararia minispora EC-137]
MEQFQYFDALLFPADGKAPHLVKLMTTPASYATQYSPSARGEGRMPHPEIHMEFIAENVPGSWDYQAAIRALDGMRNKFAQPYMIFFPVVSRDGMPFPINRTLREVQGDWYQSNHAWRGNVVVAKYRDATFKQLVNMTMADYPIIKNYLSTHGCP